MKEIVAASLGQPFEVVAEPRGGHTRAWRAVIRLESGQRRFVKVASDDRTAEALRREHAVLNSLEVDWVAGIVSWLDGPKPVLVLEDLSRAQWPPNWPADPNPLFETLEVVRRTRPPLALESMPPIEVSPWNDLDPAAVAQLSPLPPGLLEANHTRLIELSAQIDLTGSEFVHADLSAENLCFAERGPVIVDWEFASLGNGDLDVATALLDLRNETGKCPDVLSDAAGWAALLGGFMARQATATPPVWAADGKRLRRLQLEAMRGALRWVADVDGW